MQTFGKFIIVACLALLTWHQAALHIRWQAETGVLVVVAVGTMVLTCKSKRTGYALALLMGLAYLAELLLVVHPASQLIHLQPLLVWSGGLIACSAMLLGRSGEPRRKQPEYERHALF